MESTTYDGPVLDNHLHLNEADGEGMAAVEEFAAAGGTHVIVINRPATGYVDTVETVDDFIVGFEQTCAVVERAQERLPGTAWAVLGVHPTTISHLLENGLTPDEAAELMANGLDHAAEYVRQGDALGLKSGRPHYAVDDAVAAASNRVLKHAMTLAGGVGCAVQLHTESGDRFPDIASMATAAGVAPERVVKHYAAGPLGELTPSVTANKGAIDAAIESGDPFFIETDYLDDPQRPGAVLGPKTVPRRTRWLADRGKTKALRRAHVDTPAMVYGIDTEETLADDY